MVFLASDEASYITGETLSSTGERAFQKAPCSPADARHISVVCQRVTGFQVQRGDTTAPCAAGARRPISRSALLRKQSIRPSEV